MLAPSLGLLRQAPAAGAEAQGRGRLRNRRASIPVAAAVGGKSTPAAESGASSSTIESNLHRIFKGHDVERVVQSIRRNLNGVPQFEKVYADGSIQEAHAYVEGLTAIPWHDVDDPRHKWMRTLEKECPAIQAELAAYRAPEAEEALRQKGQRIWSAAAREEAIAYGPQWRTLVLQDRSRWSDTNAALFPKTAQIVRDSGCPSVEVFFARQAPGSGIKPHSDGCNFILTSHLGLDVPEGRCWLKVGNERRPWQNGKGMVFDTSFIHETFNEADVDRFVLLIRFWHPELSLAERAALQYVFDCVDDSSPGAEKAAEKQAEKRLAAGAAAAAKRKGFGKAR